MDFMGTPPAIKTPITHSYSVFGGPALHGCVMKQCEKFQKQYLSCLEAHGYDKGIVKCWDYFEDLFECKYGLKEAWRIEQISQQRKRLYREGKIKDRYFKLPEKDTYFPTNY